MGEIDSFYFFPSSGMVGLANKRALPLSGLPFPISHLQEQGTGNVTELGIELNSFSTFTPAWERVYTVIPVSSV